jgi:para-nitrobenzyl esterase
MDPRFTTIRERRLPVMVFLHLGGNSVGWGTRINFAKFSEDNDVIVVSVNYRLGLFGWFHHPALGGDGAGPLDRSGNYGTLDIIAALRWIQGNIDAFGGDRANVTLFGDSSGSKNVMSLLVSPLAQGLFHKALMMSGLSNGIPHEMARNFPDEQPAGIADSSQEVLARLLVNDGRAADRDQAKSVLAGMSDGQIAAYLRGKSPEHLLAAVKPDLYGKYSDTYFFTDGAVFPARPFFEHVQSANFRPVPVMIGMTRDETKLFQLMQPEMLDRSPVGVKVAPKDPPYYDVAAQYRTKTLYGLMSHAFARALARRGDTPVFHYRFDWDEHPHNRFVKAFVLDLDRTVGASHMVDLPFLIGDFTPNSIGFPLLFVGEHDVASRDTLSKQFQSYVMQFVRSGAPGRGLAGDLPAWQPWSALDGGGKYLVLDTPKGGGIRMAHDELTKAAVIRDLAADARLTVAQRCSIFSRTLRDEPIYTSPDSYAQFGEYARLSRLCAAP